MASRSTWEVASVKAQLRLTSQRLGQLQEKKDSQASITRRDIATLLQQGNVGLARAKAQKLISEDSIGDLLEILELHLGIVLEHVQELDQHTSPSPTVVEAASSIIFAAPHVESKDLQAVSDLLGQRLGPDFARSAAGNRDNYVSSRVIKAVAEPTPSAPELDAYLMKIARMYSVKWTPEPRRQDILNVLSEIMDPESPPIVDLPRLRKLCSRGIPDEPAWLRPRIWKLFFGILPVLKASWSSSMQRHRESYYDLVRRLLEPFSSLPPPTTPLSAMDVSLLSVAKQVSRIKPSLFNRLEDEPEQSELCPLDDTAPEGLRIDCAKNLDSRISAIHARNSSSTTSSGIPEIRLEPESNGIPEISLSGPETESISSRRPNAPTLLVSSKPYSTGSAHQTHASALLRLLYLHSSINPGNMSPHVPSLLVPLYSVMCEEIEAEDLAHAEADTFWLFEAVLGEFSELEDEDGGNTWMSKFGERLSWADSDLKDNLHAKGLDPALPHYSYRWLAPLLTQTLPLTAVLVVWDAIFSCEMRERNSNHKLECLVDVCTAMLIRARTVLLRLGKGGLKSPGLWADDDSGAPPLSPFRAWELGDAFLEGMSLLQSYPLEAAGGVDSLLQTASDLSHRRKEDEAKAASSNNLTLGERLKVTMWKGFTNQTPSPQRSPSESEESSSDEQSSPEDGDETDTPQKNAAPNLTSRLTTTIWRGITNQTSMEPPPSPLPPPSPVAPDSPSPTWPNTPLSPAHTDEGTSPERTARIWDYAGKLKDSDAAATLSKVSSNWRAKAMSGVLSTWNSRKSDASAKQQAEPVDGSGSINSAPVPQGYERAYEEGRRGSLPAMDRTGLYSPPARPAHFRPPRDTVYFHGRGPSIPGLSSPESPQSDSGFVQKTKSLQASLVSLTRSQTPSPAPKSGPRPLLLNSTSLITNTPRIRPISRSTGSTPTPERASIGNSEQWSDVMKSKWQAHHRDSLSSVSSLAPSDALNRPVKGSRSDWESDTGGPSRLVPIGRRSVSPMAPNFRIPPQRPTSQSSSGTSSDKGYLGPAATTQAESTSTVSNPLGWGRIDMLDSSPLSSPSAPKTPVTADHQADAIIRVTESEQQRGSMVLTEPSGSPLEPPAQSRKLVRKKTPPSHTYQESDTDSSVVDVLPKSPRLRSKRHAPKPANLRLQDNSRWRAASDQTSNTLAVEWPEDHDLAATPKASHFDGDVVSSTSPVSPRSPRTRQTSTDGSERTRKLSNEGREVRSRKVSTGTRARKISTETKETAKKTRDSAAEEGDDEGYDDLLSAYESEEGPVGHSVFR